jgi:hypothetical protein
MEEKGDSKQYNIEDVHTHTNKQTTKQANNNLRREREIRKQTTNESKSRISFQKKSPRRDWEGAREGGGY